MTHTPGPWGITKGAYGALNVGPASLAHPGKDATHYALERGRDLLAQRTADAALIAAAPAMLEALENIILSSDANDSASLANALADALAIVARAKAGREP